MGNPIMDMLGRINPATNGILQMIQMVKTANNPQAAINQMLQNDKRMQQVMQYVNQNGGDPKAAFYKLANEKGVDPNDILSKLR